MRQEEEEGGRERRKKRKKAYARHDRPERGQFHAAYRRRENEILNIHSIFLLFCYIVWNCMKYKTKGRGAHGHTGAAPIVVYYFIVPTYTTLEKTSNVRSCMGA